MLSDEDTIARPGIVFFCACAGLNRRTSIMNPVHRTTEDYRDVETCLALAAPPANTESPKHASGGSDCRLDTRDYAFSYPRIEARADWQVREDGGYYVPDLLSDKSYDPDRHAYAAAEDHANHLRDAERLLNDVLNLVGLMLAAIGDDCDCRAMQSEIALTIIEKKLRKIHRRIDRHDRRHTNLFLAYCGLQAKADG